MAYRGGFSFGYALTPWVKRLIIANAVVFLITYINPSFASYLAFVPGQVLLRPWTLITYMFVHGGFMHIFFNMLGLFFFGPPLEARWGSRQFLKFYIICGLGGAALSFLFVNSAIIGASAAVYGVMLAFAMNWPDMPIYIWGILPIPAKYLVGIFVAFSMLSAFGGRGDGVAHFAHLGGFAAAYLYLKFDVTASARLRGLKKFVSRRRMSVVPGGDKPPGRDVSAASRPPQQRGESDDQLLDELDKVLEKISHDGMASLTPQERRLLDDVSRRYRQN